MIARPGPRLPTGTGTAECVIGNVASARAGAAGGAIAASDRNCMSSRGTERAAPPVVAARGGGTGVRGVATLVGVEVGDIVASDRNGMSAIEAGCAGLAGAVVRGAVTGFGGAATRGGTTVLAGVPGLAKVGSIGGATVFGGAVVAGADAGGADANGAAARGGAAGGRIGASGDDRGDTGGLNGRPRAWQNCSRFSRLVTKNGSVGASFETAMANARR